jgi:hypothetical protein
MMIWDLLIFGGVWFWITFAGFGVWFLAACWRERVVQSTSAIIIFFLLLTFFGNFNLFRWIYDNPIITLEYVGIYIVAGILWAIMKWYLFNTKIRSVFLEIRDEFKRKRNLPSGPIPEELRKEWAEFATERSRWEPVKRYYEYDLPGSYAITSAKSFVPQARKYKDTIIFWMAYWPLSFVFFFLSDFLERLWYRIYEAVASIFTRITDSVFRKMPEDFNQ